MINKRYEIVLESILVISLICFTLMNIFFPDDEIYNSYKYILRNIIVVLGVVFLFIFIKKKLTKS